MQKNLKPIDLKKTKMLCQFLGGTGHRSVEELKDSLTRFVVVIEAHVGCSDVPGLFLQASRRNVGYGGLTHNLREMALYDDRETAERRAAKIREPYEVMTLAEACRIVYTCSSGDVRRVQKDGNGRWPTAAQLASGRIRFYGSCTKPDGTLAGDYFDDPIDAVAHAFNRELERHKEMVAEFDAARKAIKRITRGKIQ